MNRRAAVQKLLLAKFSEGRSRNPAYSLRAFSRRIGLSPTSTSLILNGKRQVSRKLAEKLCHKLMLDPHQRSNLLKSFGLQTVDAADADDSEHGAAPNPLQLEADQFRLISDWYYYGILSLIKTRGFKSDPAWISRRLGISLKETADALERLERLGILVQGKGGKLTRKVPRYRTSDDVIDLSVRQSSFQGLELAKRSLEQDPVEARDFTHLTMAIYPDKLPQAKTLIRRFQDQLEELLENGKPGLEPAEVYRFSTQLIPLSRSAAKESK